MGLHAITPLVFDLAKLSGPQHALDSDRGSAAGGGASKVRATGAKRNVGIDVGTGGDVHCEGMF